MNTKPFIIFAFIAVFAIILINLGTKSKAIQDYNSGKESSQVVTITDKQIINNISSNNNGNVATERECIIFTDKGVYTCGSFYDELSIYGQLQIGKTYEIWTSPVMDFQYEANIVRAKLKQ